MALCLRMNIIFFLSSIICKPLKCCEETKLFERWKSLNTSALCDLITRVLRTYVFWKFVRHTSHLDGVSTHAIIIVQYNCPLVAMTTYVDDDSFDLNLSIHVLAEYCVRIDVHFRYRETFTIAHTTPYTACTHYLPVIDFGLAGWSCVCVYIYVYRCRRMSRESILVSCSAGISACTGEPRFDYKAKSKINLLARHIYLCVYVPAQVRLPRGFDKTSNYTRPDRRTMLGGREYRDANTFHTSPNRTNKQNKKKEPYNCIRFFVFYWIDKFAKTRFRETRVLLIT